MKPDSALLTFGGYGTDSNKVLYGARLYDYYGSSRYSNDSLGRVTLETDSSGGTAGQIINGNAGPGHGILTYETVSKVRVTNPQYLELEEFSNTVLSAINVYDVQKFKLVNGQISPIDNVQNPQPTSLSTWGAQADRTMGLSMEIMTESVTVGNGSVNISQLAGGWTLVHFKQGTVGTYYFNYASQENALLCTYSESLS